LNSAILETPDYLSKMAESVQIDPDQRALTIPMAVPIIELFKDRFTGALGHDLTIQNIIQLAHPDHIVTRTKRDCDFYEFALDG
jgi:hypothetical protein